jgi:hypothetical protein
LLGRSTGRVSTDASCGAVTDAVVVGSGDVPHRSVKDVGQRSANDTGVLAPIGDCARAATVIAVSATAMNAFRNIPHPWSSLDE